MTYRPRARCRRCGIPRGLAGGVSRSGLCAPCGERALAENITQMKSKTGPGWEKYRDGMTDYAARLWGASAIPDTLPPGFSQPSLLELIT
jgi:hypothetical protein